MHKLQRDQIVDFMTYEERRPAARAAAMALKVDRRIHVGPHLTFLFENTQTVAYQVQEMMRAERLVRERDIQHEIDTYNELLGGPGELGFTLLIEITDEADRRDKLARWIRLVEHIYAELPDGRRVFATFDPRQVSHEKLSSVHYMKLDVGGVTPIALGCDLADHTHRAVLTTPQRAALRQDLASDA